MVLDELTKGIIYFISICFLIAGIVCAVKANIMGSAFKKSVDDSDLGVSIPANTLERNFYFLKTKDFMSNEFSDSFKKIKGYLITYIIFFIIGFSPVVAEWLGLFK